MAVVKNARGRCMRALSLPLIWSIVRCDVASPSSSTEPAAAELAPALLLSLTPPVLLGVLTPDACWGGLGRIMTALS
jgi:hypothetical protein